MRQWLEARGYAVQEQRFSFQPAALSAFPLVGAGLGWLTLIQLPLLTFASVPGWAALAVWLAGAGALGVLAWGIGSGTRVPGAEQREDANLIARAPGGEPVRRWVVAHLDSKAQGHSMAGRLVAVWVLVLAVLALTALGAARLVGGAPLDPVPVAAGAGLALAAGGLAARGRLQGGSQGARDNGTGLLAALEAAAGAPVPGVGILVTGAEEFGLVGARALVAGGLGVAGTEVINLDTIADRGDLAVVIHDPAHRPLADRLAAALAGIGPRVVVRRLPVGILVDSVPLARAGAVAVTIGRLDWSVLRVLHTPRDTLDGLDLGPARAVGRVLAALPPPR